MAVPKDPNAPKRPVTAYIIFSTEVRQKLHSDQPEMGFVELMRHIGGLWNKLPAEEKQVNTSYVKPFMPLLCPHVPVVPLVLLSVVKYSGTPLN